MRKLLRRDWREWRGEESPNLKSILVNSSTKPKTHSRSTKGNSEPKEDCIIEKITLKVSKWWVLFTQVELSLDNTSERRSIQFENLYSGPHYYSSHTRKHKERLDRTRFQIDTIFKVSESLIFWTSNMTMPEKRIFAKAGHICMICGFRARTKNKYRELQDHLVRQHFQVKNQPRFCPFIFCCFFKMLWILSKT